jgi:hypothetical protein
MPASETTDRDGNVLRRGMAVVSGGDVWVIAHVSPRLGQFGAVLDRIRPDGRGERRFIGRRRIYCVHVIGYQIPQVVH